MGRMFIRLKLAAQQESGIYTLVAIMAEAMNRSHLRENRYLLLIRLQHNLLPTQIYCSREETYPKNNYSF